MKYSGFSWLESSVKESHSFWYSCVLVVQMFFIEECALLFPISRVCFFLLMASV